MVFNGFEVARMFLENWFTKCDESSINICRNMPGAYAELITHERRLACLERTSFWHKTKLLLLHVNFFCSCNTSLIMAAV